MVADPMAIAVDDARALLDAMLASDWDNVHVVAGETEIFIAKSPGRPNPLFAGGKTVDPTAPDQRATAREAVPSPHVATVVDVVPVGTPVAAGDRLAVLRVLDDEQDLTAAVAGTVCECPAVPGTLLDYGAPVVVLEIAA